MTPPDERPSRRLPKAARILLYCIGVPLVPPAFLLGLLSPHGNYPVGQTLVYVTVTTALALAIHRFGPRLDARLRLPLSPFVMAAVLAYALAWWGLLAGLLFSVSPTP